MASSRERAELEDMAAEIFELTKLSWVLADRAKTKIGSDLSESEFLALDLLDKNGKMTVGQLQRELGVLPAQMSRVIRSLEEKHDGPLVTCAINPEDKRKIDVSLTEAGCEAHQGYRSAKLSLTVETLRELDRRERREFMRILGHMRELLAKKLGSK